MRTVPSHGWGFIFYYYLSMPHDIVLWLLPNALEVVRDIPIVKYVSYHRGMFHGTFSLIKTNVFRRKQHERKVGVQYIRLLFCVCGFFLVVYGVFALDVEK